MKIKIIFMDVWVCARCHQWVGRIPKIEHGAWDKGHMCKCGCTSIELRGEGRPLGFKSRFWKRELEYFKLMLKDIPRGLWSEYCNWKA